ncbi:uncharacterized protein F4812DRAFT_437517, partial [Daldinia caldariorum]|uniref:uncharacterized protein n=1 Tax=Daldinia caldariorum TaxID=326644 RepID=UPI002008E36A
MQRLIHLPIRQGIILLSCSHLIDAVRTIIITTVLWIGYGPTTPCLMHLPYTEDLAARLANRCHKLESITQGFHPRCKHAPHMHDVATRQPRGHDMRRRQIGKPAIPFGVVSTDQPFRGVTIRCYCCCCETAFRFSLT